jgi:hypothetical protein
LDLLDFIEDNAGREVYPEQANKGAQDGNQSKQLPIRTGKVKDVMVFDSLRSVSGKLGGDWSWLLDLLDLLDLLNLLDFLDLVLAICLSGGRPARIPALPFLQIWTGPAVGSHFL